MFNWLGRIVGSDKAIAAATDGLINGIGKAFYTAQEKSEDKIKLFEAEIRAREKAAEQLVEFHKATSGQNLARRIIAFSLLGYFLVSKGVAQMLAVAAVFLDPSKAALYREAAEMTNSYVAEIQVWIAGILAFYFGLPKITEMTTAYRNRNSK